MIRGIEVDTTVPARIETNIPSRSPERDSSTWRCDITVGEPSLERVVDMQILRNDWLTVINYKSIGDQSQLISCTAAIFSCACRLSILKRWWAHPQTSGATPPYARRMPSRTRSWSLVTPAHWIVWTVVLFVLTVALGLAAKTLPALRLAGLDAAVNRVNSPLLDQTALVLDRLDHPIVVAVILAVVFVVLLFVVGWRRALGVCVTTGAGWLTTLVVKTVVAQPRPSTGGLTHLLHISPATLSYPSGHVVFAAALVTALAMVCRSARIPRRSWSIVGALFVLAVGWSRLYVGVHYGTDIVGGILNGVAGALLIAGLWNLATRGRERSAVS